MGSSAIRLGCGLASAGVLSMAAAAQAVVIDGTLDTSAGYQLVSTQVNPSNTIGKGVNDATYTPTFDPNDPAHGYAQLSNCYAQIDKSNPAAPVLNLFFGGNLNVNAQSDDYLELLLQTHAGGSANLNAFGTSTAPTTLPGSHTPRSYNLLTFDTGFKPNAFISFNNGGTPIGTSTPGFPEIGPTPTYYNINAGANTDTAPTITDQLNQALRFVRVGAGGTDIRGGTNTTADPGFAGASTGIEMSISLTELGWDGGDINALAFIGEGNHNRVNNQILGPIGSFPDATPTDYRDIGARDFADQTVYPGNQFFTISAATPEPASLGLIAAIALPLLKRRRAV